MVPLWGIGGRPFKYIFFYKIKNDNLLIFKFTTTPSLPAVSPDQSGASSAIS